MMSFFHSKNLVFVPFISLKIKAILAVSEFVSKDTLKFIISKQNWRIFFFLKLVIFEFLSE